MYWSCRRARSASMAARSMVLSVAQRPVGVTVES
jgi:hypothetical protein